jgi:hypothetical protein
MLCYSDAPYIESLTQLIETQSKPTIIKWCADYAQAYYMPFFEKHFPDSRTPHIALEAAAGSFANAVLTRHIATHSIRVHGQGLQKCGGEIDKRRSRNREEGIADGNANSEYQILRVLPVG